MKRLRDDLCVNPQVKRSCGSSTGGESYGLPHEPAAVGGGRGNGGGGTGDSGTDGGGGGGGGASTQKLTADDALTYLKIVKDMFLDQREKYDLFLDAMKDFKSQRIDTAGVITRVKELFKGYPNLVLGFNTFLPKGYEITLTDEKEAPSKRIMEFEDAINFVNKIKKRFQNDDHVYKAFLATLNMYRKAHKGIAEVHQEVTALFQDQPDLLDEFTRFLPNSSTSVSAPYTITTLSHIDKDPHQNRINGSHGEWDPSFDRSDDDDKTVLRMHNESKQHPESESRDERSHDQDGRDPDNENNGDISFHRHCGETKCTRKFENSGGNSNLPSNDDKDALKSIYCHEFTFCEKVKERLHSADVYLEFLKCLHIYSTEIITRKELQGLVVDLIGNYPDLMDGFDKFLERCERIDGFLDGVMGKKTLCTEGNYLKALRIEEKSSRQNHELGRKKEERDSSKYCRKSIQELDLSNCQSCSPSYRLLPADCLLSSASQRSELDTQVLNDRWVSMTSGSEDYSFKHMRRNQYEETLFRCEDDRFELDMLLESVNSTAKRVEELLNSIDNNSVGLDSCVSLEDHFTVLNLRCIERLYGEHGLDVIDILRKNATLVLPVILSRLKQKQEEWIRCQLDFNKVWAEIYFKNHYKSLVHQGFYFKQLDSKTLSAKWHGVNSILASNDTIKEGLGSKTRTKDILSPEGLGTLKSNPSMNGKFPKGSRFDGKTEDSVYRCKIEKEEGELSPNDNFEDKLGCSQDGNSQALSKKNCTSEEMQCQTRCHDDISLDNVGKNDADVDDKDNKNAFEVAENVLGGESTAIECPKEEHREEEGGEQDNLDGKALSEGGKPKDRRVFYGNSTYYALFSLHQILYETILSAKVSSLNNKSKTIKDMNLDLYASFMDALFSLLGGSSDNAKFEDDCRSLIGNQSYVLSNLDKLIYKLVEQLQTVSSEEVDCKLLLYEYEKSRKQEKCDDSVYYENVHVLLHEENIYRFECTSFPTRLSIQLVYKVSDKSGVPVSVDPNFTAHLDNDYPSVCGERTHET